MEDLVYCAFKAESINIKEENKQVSGNAKLSIFVLKNTDFGDSNVAEVVLLNSCNHCVWSSFCDAQRPDSLGVLFRKGLGELSWSSELCGYGSGEEVPWLIGVLNYPVAFI